MIRILSRFFGTGLALVFVFALSLFGCGSDIGGSESGQGEADPEKELVLQTFSEGCTVIIPLSFSMSFPSHKKSPRGCR